MGKARCVCRFSGIDVSLSAGLLVAIVCKNKIIAEREDMEDLTFQHLTIGTVLGDHCFFFAGGNRARANSRARDLL